jgi:phosphoribosylamine-glycine ligase
MNILIIGSGGREHVLADAYAKKNNMKFVIFTENELEMMGIHTFKR